MDYTVVQTMYYFYVWTSFLVIIIIAFWHVPYAANNTEFSATLATTAGSVPAYSPLVIPSFVRVCRKQSTIPRYRFGNVCIFTLIVSKGWPTYTNPTPPEIISNMIIIKWTLNIHIFTNFKTVKLLSGNMVNLSTSHDFTVSSHNNKKLKYENTASSSSLVLFFFILF